MDNGKKEIGARIRNVRLTLKLSQVEFAKLVGVSNTAVSSYESGDNFPSLPALIRIAKIGSVTCDWLVLGVDVQNSELSNEEAKLVSDFRKAHIHARKTIVAIAEYAALASQTQR